jgi:hypothetical protein
MNAKWPAWTLRRRDALGSVGGRMSAGSANFGADGSDEDFFNGGADLAWHVWILAQSFGIFYGYTIRILIM